MEHGSQVLITFTFEKKLMHHRREKVSVVSTNWSLAVRILIIAHGDITRFSAEFHLLVLLGEQFDDCPGQGLD